MSSVDHEAVRRPRGRPRAFDREAALRRAMEVFWDKGFDNCSMSDLVAAMGINSPSLYAAFGSKEDLFREAMDLYIGAEGGAPLRALAAHRSCRDALQAMLGSTVELFTQPDVSRGCMLFLGAMNIGAQHHELGVHLHERRRKVAAMIAEKLSEGVRDGELAPDTDVGKLAELCVTVFAGLSIQAQDGVSRATLSGVIDQFVSTLPFRAVHAENLAR